MRIANIKIPYNGIFCKCYTEQKNKILTVVDNSDKFMEESLDLLQESNQKLDRETAYKLYQYSVNRLKTNYGKVYE